MKEFTEEYLSNLNELIDNKDEEQVKSQIQDLHPADIAELVGDLNDQEALFIMLLLDDETAADVLVELDEDQRADLLELMPNEEIAKQVEQMDADDAVDVIQELDEEDREDVISHIDDVEQAGDIVDLLKYDEDTAGGYMSTEMIVVNENMSMPDCIKAMRQQAEDLDEIYNIYVVDDDNRLKGLFPLKTTITNPSASKIKHVMEPDPFSVRTVSLKRRIQDRLKKRVSPADCISDNPQIGLDGELRSVIALHKANSRLLKLIAHGGINIGIAPGHGVAAGSRKLRKPTHKRAANA